MDAFVTAMLEPALTPAVLDCPDCAVTAEFPALPPGGLRFRIDVGPDFFTGPRARRYLQHTFARENRSDNHMQGVQRFGDRLYITAGDLTEKVAHLFVCKLDLDGNGVPTGGRLERIICIDDVVEHPGGMQRLGNVLAIAMQGKGDSSVKFLQLDDPSSPKLIPAATIPRTGLRSASAAALARFPNGRVLVGVNWFESRFLRKGRAWLELYLSAGPGIAHGWEPAHVKVNVGDFFSAAPSWQSIGFLQPALAAVDGAGGTASVHLIGLRNTRQDVSNFAKGQDLADHLVLTFPAAALQRWDPQMKPRLQHVATRAFTFDHAWGNFSAAAGVDIEPDGSLTLYAAHHWRIGQELRLSICHR